SLTVIFAVTLFACAAVRAQETRRVPPWVFDGYLSVQAMEGNGVRRGYFTHESPQNIARRRDPATADRLARQGVGFVILQGLMGSGLANEREGITANKPLAAALKAKGIRRVLYVQ